MAAESTCFHCRKLTSTKKLQRCGRCLGALYCNSDCQKKDWPNHRELCVESDGWPDKYRGCRDGSLHEGKLELMTWEYIEREGGIRMGWGNIAIEEAENMKRKFKVDFKGKKRLLFKYWPQAFRWTCCGTDGLMNEGCDHHGSGSRPCTCDFCHMGKPVPDSIYRGQTGPSMGLSLRRGPDPRSFDPTLAARALKGRRALGLEL